MTAALFRFLRVVAGSFRDLAPIVAVVAFFQVVVLRQPIPDLFSILVGVVLVMLGLTLFLRGLNLSLFPLGAALAGAFARKGSLAWLLAFAFALGFGTTAAEPALSAVAAEAARVAAAAGAIADADAARAGYALILGGYVLIVAMTAFAPDEIVGITYDSGGVTTSTITMPLVTALGVGLATVIKGRNPLLDGFGLIAFASLVPMPFVIAFGMVLHG